LNPTLTYGSSGEFDVTLYLSGGCANDTVQDTISVFTPASAAFVYEPDIPTTRTDVQFIYSGNGATDFQWDFGTGETGTGIRPSNLFETEGQYDITLITTDPNGCSDTTVQTIEILLQPVIYFPNTITLNGLPENGAFRGYGIGVVDAEIQVFDRWGTLLYASENVTEVMTTGWDGTYNGSPVKQGAYPFKVSASFYNGATFQKLGTVTVIR
jgi:gliding motility-associated-like protein